MKTKMSLLAIWIYNHRLVLVALALLITLAMSACDVNILGINPEDSLKGYDPDATRQQMNNFWGN